VDPTGLDNIYDMTSGCNAPPDLVYTEGCDSPNYGNPLDDPFILAAAGGTAMTTGGGSIALATYLSPYVACGAEAAYVWAAMHPVVMEHLMVYGTVLVANWQGVSGPMNPATGTAELLGNALTGGLTLFDGLSGYRPPPCPPPSNLPPECGIINQNSPPPVLIQ
jgi:hypothetical protein